MERNVKICLDQEKTRCVKTGRRLNKRILFVTDFIKFIKPALYQRMS